MLSRFLSISTTNFCNANNNGNANNNNASNTNGVVPDSLIGSQQTIVCDSNLLKKETGILRSGENRDHDGCCSTKSRSSYQHDSFFLLTDPLNLLYAYQESKKGVSWKYSIQKYEQHLIKNISDTIKTLEQGEIVTKGFFEFDINERGKNRHIKSVHISERVVQKALCNQILTPILSKSLIHDNGASLQGKGTSFTRDRIKVHLMRHYRKYGTAGYIVLLDCRKYFDSIEHSILYPMIDKQINDKKTSGIVHKYIDEFGDKSLGLGSQVSQITAIFFPNSIDHYAKENLHLKQYGRYMDDSYFIVPTKEEAQEKLFLLSKKYDSLGIPLNLHKTQIVKLTRNFTFMKCIYRISGTGKILIHPDKAGLKRMCTKLKKFKEMGLPLNQVDLAYKAWKGHWISLNGDSRKAELLYSRLYGEAS
ncbi:RNA-directed DNA polymerase [Oceanispirochaeta sp.]|jgi:RNA-directed DNA polymerase|uniref:RNA-directed DNA polymerase n=1 Tax=Oceanispirochaeta sp. TaxID=2035350 RepID=UPI002606F95E|nr:RNA-directed DNA polymerase [Oceanispirochaeta sp.]MDA3957969.1 RNA-directed DNA polymerase [Oceanispirochaeta sp.]